MALIKKLKSIGIDAYLVLLLGTMFIGSFLPVRGQAAVFVSYLAYYAVALLFFVYGAKLNTRAVFDALTHWRLQSLVMSVTYIFFPLVGLAFAWALRGYLDESLIQGIIFLSVIPSTVQSSIAFTSLARGNIAGAVCAASLSNLAGVLLTPMLAALLLKSTGDGGISTDAIKTISIQILLPFIAGQLMRPLIGDWIGRNKMFTLAVDRGSILLIVYTAFSAGRVADIWSQVSVMMLVILILMMALMLLIVFGLIAVLNKAAKFNREDGIVMLFCASTKSLASGLPIANILFAGSAVSLIILPLMIYHQIQLFVCAIIAQRLSQDKQ